jgi:hypothetical protein
MNERTRPRLDFWIETAVVLLFCGLVAAWFIRSSNKPLDAENLAIHAGDLRSLSASGALLSDESSQGKITGTFFHEQIELTDDKVDDINDALEKSDTIPEVKSESEQLKALGDRVSSAFQLMSADNSSQSGHELKQLSSSLKSLEDELKKRAEK